MAGGNDVGGCRHEQPEAAEVGSILFDGAAEEHQVRGSHQASGRLATGSGAQGRNGFSFVCMCREQVLGERHQRFGQVRAENEVGWWTRQRRLDETGGSGPSIGIVPGLRAPICHPHRLHASGGGSHQAASGRWRGRTPGGVVVQVRPSGAVRWRMPSGSSFSVQPGRCPSRWWRAHLSTRF
jgi:hypothetical protein